MCTTFRSAELDQGLSPDGAGRMLNACVHSPENFAVAPSGYYVG